jgi:replicative DNA helicase
VRSVHGWAPNLIVLDYVSIVKPQIHRDKRHTEMQEIVEDFRGLCVSLNCVGWTAAQINRSGAKKEIADGTDAAGSWDQLATADHIITINQTREEKQRNEIRLFIDKCRDGHSEFEIGPLYTDWERMCFVRKSNKSIQEVKEEWKNRFGTPEQKG